MFYAEWPLPVGTPHCLVKIQVTCAVDLSGPQRAEKLSTGTVFAWNWSLSRMGDARKKVVNGFTCMSIRRVGSGLITKGHSCLNATVWEKGFRAFFLRVHVPLFGIRSQVWPRPGGSVGWSVIMYTKRLPV